MKFFSNKSKDKLKIKDLLPDEEALDYHILHFEDFTDSLQSMSSTFYSKWTSFFYKIISAFKSRLGLIVLLLFGVFIFTQIRNANTQEQVLGILDANSLEILVNKIEGDSFSLKKTNAEEWITADEKTIIQVGDSVATQANTRLVLSNTDKSDIFLDNQSSLKFLKYAEDEVVIELLKGKSYFYSKRDEETFTVKKGNIEFHASKAQFYIDTSDNFNELIVVEGSVRVVTPSNVDYIYKGNSAMISSQAGSIIKGKVDNSIFDNTFLLWCTGNRVILNAMFTRPLIEILSPSDETRIDSDITKVSGKVKSEVDISEFQVNESIYKVTDLPKEKYNPDSGQFTFDVELLIDGENRILVAVVDTNKQRGEDYIFIYKNQNPTQSSENLSPTQSVSATPISSPTATIGVSATATSQLTPTSSPTPTATKKTATSTPRPTATRTPTPTPTNTPIPTNTPTPTPTLVPTSTPIATDIPTPSATPTPTETPIPTI